MKHNQSCSHREVPGSNPGGGTLFFSINIIMNRKLYKQTIALAENGRDFLKITLSNDYFIEYSLFKFDLMLSKKEV